MGWGLHNGVIVNYHYQERNCGQIVILGNNKTNYLPVFLFENNDFVFFCHLTSLAA